jgi:hypothetical protein
MWVFSSAFLLFKEQMRPFGFKAKGRHRFQQRPLV